jgi:hypothetical protein
LQQAGKYQRLVFCLLSTNFSKIGVFGAFLLPFTLLPYP